MTPFAAACLLAKPSWELAGAREIELNRDHSGLTSFAANRFP